MTSISLFNRKENKEIQYKYSAKIKSLSIIN